MAGDLLRKNGAGLAPFSANFSAVSRTTKSIAMLASRLGDAACLADRERDVVILRLQAFLPATQTDVTDQLQSVEKRPIQT